MKKLRYGFFLFCLWLPFTSMAWNALGHKLVAQIAYSNLTPHAKRMFNYYNHALNKDYKSQSLISAAIWLDNLRYRNVNWFNSLHYENLFFTEDGTTIPLAVGNGAVWGMMEAKQVLLRPQSSDFEKGISLRILLHVVGDIHQPLHAASRVSKRFPSGDRGGNLVGLGKNSIARNLHTYWDKGGGLWVSQEKLPQAKLALLASQIAHKYPCIEGEQLTDFPTWAQESHQLAITVAYKIHEGEVPDDGYQQRTQNLSEQRIALAGCRLASLLNQIDSNASQGHAKPIKHHHKKLY